MKRLLVLSMVMLAGLQSSVRSEIIFFDDFTTPGTLVGTTPDIGGGNWTTTGTTVTNPLTINASSELVIGNTGQDAFAALARSVPKTDGDFLTSTFSLTVSTVLSTGDYFLHYMDPALSTTTSFYNRVFARPGTAAGFFQIGVLGISTGTATYGADLTIGQTYTVKSDWNFVAGPLNDTFDIEVDSAPYLTGVAWGGTNAEPANISAVNVRQGAVATGPTVAIDNLEVTAVAIPEPNSLLLLSGGLSVVGMLRRRK